MGSYLFVNGLQWETMNFMILRQTLHDF